MSKTLNERPESAVEVAREFTTLRLRPSTQHGPILAGPSKIIEPQPRRSRLIGILTALALLLGFGWMYGAAIVLVVTNQGELTIEVDDPDVEVTVRQNDAEVHHKSTQRRFRVRPVDGLVEFHDPETGAVALTKRFELKRAGQHVAVTVTVRELSASAPSPAVPATAPSEQVSDEPPPVAAESASIGGLDFDEVGRIETPLLLPVDTPLTVEFDVTHGELQPQETHGFLFQHPGNLDIKIMGSRALVSTGGWPDLRASFFHEDVAQPGRRRQLAVTGSDTALQLFVDGTLVERKTSSPPEANAMRQRVTLGKPGAVPSFRAFDGLVHRVRIRRGERYDSDDTPEAEWEADESTLALYDFRTVDPGTEVQDRSGQGNHGQIVSSKWVQGTNPTKSAAGSPAAAPR